MDNGAVHQMKCEECPSFQGRGSSCKMGLFTGKTDARTCEDFGKTNQKELLIERGIWERVGQSG